MVDKVLAIVNKLTDGRIIYVILSSMTFFFYAMEAFYLVEILSSSFNKVRVKKSQNLISQPNGVAGNW